MCEGWDEAHVRGFYPSDEGVTPAGDKANPFKPAACKGQLKDDAKHAWTKADCYEISEAQADHLKVFAMTSTTECYTVEKYNCCDWMWDVAKDLGVQIVGEDKDISSNIPGKVTFPDEAAAKSKDKKQSFESTDANKSDPAGFLKGIAKP